MQRVCGIMSNKSIFRKDSKGGYHHAEGGLRYAKGVSQHATKLKMVRNP